MSIISIEKDVAETLNYDDMIDVFANEKARKITLKNMLNCFVFIMLL